MEWNMIVAILLFLAGTILMPIGLKKTGKQKYLIMAASVAADLIGVLVLFK
jgi:hypothetical protein